MENRLESLLAVAIKKKISDIHFTKKKEGIKIEFRLKQKLISYPSCVQDERLMQYLQYRANLQMGHALMPQTGQFEMEVNQHHLSLRYSIIHSPLMSNGVLRILNHTLALSVDHLSRDQSQNELFKNLGYYDHGLVLIGGPTSSGKTTTLYTILDAIKHRRIFTIEDPIEILKENYVQLQVNPKQNLDYEMGIRQLLRHDPDIIMIGEIRDEKTAKSAIRAALTGHLVFSTIHAVNGLGTIYRLMELVGDDPLVATILKVVINQRLAMNPLETRKVAIYEILSRKELDAYFKDKVLPTHHQDIEGRIRQAISEKAISAKTLFE